MISATRTAASAAAAADWVTRSRPRPERIGFVGAGLIARYVHTFLASTGWTFDEIAVHDLSPDSAAGFVGYLDGAPVAMGGWTFTDSDLVGRVAKIRRMFVDGTVRRLGLARAVLVHLETEAAQQGVTRVILATGRPQVEAISFYRSHGYCDIAPFGYYADEDGVVCLGKDLEPRTQPTS